MCALDKYPEVWQLVALCWAPVYSAADGFLKFGKEATCTGMCGCGMMKTNFLPLFRNNSSLLLCFGTGELCYIGGLNDKGYLKSKPNKNCLQLIYKTVDGDKI